MRKSLYLTCAVLAIVLAGCIADQVKRPGLSDQSGIAAYEQLIALYPEDSQGLGKESVFPTIEHQPMTYGLIASAEALRFRKTQGEESRRRVRKAVRWLIDNQDLDRDGLPGWGLPQEWDAFADGTTNPVNQPYTITTAIALNGLLDALSIPAFWSPSQRDEIRLLTAKVVLRWCREIWSEGFSGGYFWYSPSPADNIFAVNSPSMFLGSMSRMLREQGDTSSQDEHRLVESRADDMAKAIVATVGLRQGSPFWDYRPAIKPEDPKRPNDLIHHVYTLWGIETYRDCGGRVSLPWTRTQAIESLNRFWRDGYIAEFPQDVTYVDKQAPFNTQQAILWSAGSLLAAYAQWGDRTHAQCALEAIERDYGPWPHLRLRSKQASEVQPFYARHAAHVLWGLALHRFGQ